MDMAKLSSRNLSKDSGNTSNIHLCKEEFLEGLRDVQAFGSIQEYAGHELGREASRCFKAKGSVHSICNGVRAAKAVEPRSFATCSHTAHTQKGCALLMQQAILMFTLPPRSGIPGHCCIV